MLSLEVVNIIWPPHCLRLYRRVFGFDLWLWVRVRPSWTMSQSKGVVLGPRPSRKCKRPASSVQPSPAPKKSPKISRYNFLFFSFLNSTPQPSTLYCLIPDERISVLVTLLVSFIFTFRSFYSESRSAVNWYICPHRNWFFCLSDPTIISPFHPR